MLYDAMDYDMDVNSTIIIYIIPYLSFIIQYHYDAMDYDLWS